MPPSVSLAYVYADDTRPLVVVNPPADLPGLLADWERVNAGDGDGEPLDGWDTVRKWLEGRRVVVVEPTVHVLGD